MSERANARRLDITLPPPGLLPELDEVAENHKRLTQDRKVTGTRLGGLRGKRERTVEAERATFAKALKDETKEPESKIASLDKEIEACERRFLALEEAIDASIGDLIAVADECRDTWTERVLEQIAEVKDEYAGAIEGVAQASDAFLASLSLLSFVRGFPETEPTYRVRGSHVAGLRAPNGDPYWLGEVLQALREDAQVEFSATSSRVSRDPLAARIQAEFEEKRSNERAGHGFRTDADVQAGVEIVV